MLFIKVPKVFALIAGNYPLAAFFHNRNYRMDGHAVVVHSSTQFGGKSPSCPFTLPSGRWKKDHPRLMNVVRSTTEISKKYAPRHR